MQKINPQANPRMRVSVGSYRKPRTVLLFVRVGVFTGDYAVISRIYRTFCRSIIPEVLDCVGVFLVASRTNFPSLNTVCPEAIA
jgi:hypothetical protein